MPPHRYSPRLLATALLLVGALITFLFFHHNDKAVAWSLGGAEQLGPNDSTAVESMMAPISQQTNRYLSLAEATVVGPPSQLRRGSNRRLILNEAVIHERRADPKTISEEVLFSNLQSEDFGPLTLNDYTRSAIEVEVDFAAVDRFLASESGTIFIPLSKDLEVPVHVDRVVARGDFTTTLIGEVVDDTYSEVLIVFHDGAVSGIASFHDTNTHYQFGMAGNGQVAIRDLEPDSGENACLNCQNHEIWADLEEPSDGEAIIHDVGEIAFDVPDGRSPFDVVVGYSAEGRINAGGAANIEADTIASVDRLNEALNDSGAGVWFCSLVAMIEDPDTSFSDSNYSNLVGIITDLSDKNDGDLDAVTDLMDELGADQATFLSNGSLANAAGVAQRPGRYSIVSRQRLVSDRRTFSHEMGHNIGFYHAWGQGGGAAANPTNVDNYGWRFVGSGGTRFRTIMAGAKNWGGSRVGHFSNPDIDFNGGATGVPPGFDATDESANPAYDQDLVSGGSDGNLDEGYDGSNPQLGARNGVYAANTGGGVLANRAIRTNLALLEPAANAAVSMGDTSTVFWYGGDHTDTVSLELWKGGVMQSTIATNISAEQRWFDWDVPTVLVGSDYQIRVILNGSTFADGSEFSIIEPVGPLVAHWTLDDGSGSNVSDETSNGFDGTQTDANWVTGLVSNALNFNGSTSSVSLPSAAFESIDKEITIAMWVFGDGNQPQQDSVFYAVNGSDARVLNIHLPWSDGQVFWDAGVAGTSVDRINLAATVDQYKGRWNHWTFTKNTTNGEMRIYYNGSLWHQGTGKTRSMAGITSAFLGSQITNRRYSGAIDEVQLYNVSLSDSEVDDFYNSYTTTNGVPFAWLIENGYAPSEAIALIDSDQDSQTNEIEWFLGTNPSVNDSPFGPLLIGADTFSFNYTRRKIDGLVITAEWSADLTESSWKTMDLTEAVIDVDGEIETVSVTTEIDEDQKFIRIRIGD